MSHVRAPWATALLAVACWLSLGRVYGQEPPALTAAEQQLLQEAEKLTAEGDKLFHQAQLATATDQLQKALALRQRVYSRDKYPDGHPALAQSLNWLGIVLQAQGEYGKAEPFYRQGLDMYQALYPKAHYPDGHPNLASSLGNLGGLLQA